MTRTVVESKTKTAIIGFDEPFCVIGERINPTGRKILNAELEAGDYSRVEADAIAQTAAGATIPSLVRSPSGLGGMILAKSVDGHVDTRRICERVTFEHHNKEFVDAGTIITKCANDFDTV